MIITRRSSFAALAGTAALGACATTQAQTGVSAEHWPRWLTRYGAAWEARDAAAAGALFTEDATYHEMPFDAPMAGRAAIEAYWTRVTAAQSDIRFSYDVVSFEGDTGVAHWHAAFNAGTDAIELDGVFVCRFADEAHVRSLQEWWHVKATPAVTAS